MRRILLRQVATLLVLSCAGAAVIAGPRKPIVSFKNLGADETVLVGRVELVPPLHEHDQRLRGPMSGKYRNKMFMMVDAEFRELEAEPGFGDFKGRIDATLGEEFFVRSGREPIFFIAGMMVLEIGHGMADRAYFPGGLRAAIHPGDRAVYIGTIRYHRDDFFEVTKIEIVDDFDRVRAEFRQRFGAEHPLRKALLAPVDGAGDELP